MSQLTRASSRTVIGRIGYLNIEPFFESLEHDAEQRVVPPRELARLCREGEVDAGALPVAELFRMEEEFEPLGELGIAAEGRVRSVLVFSRWAVRRSLPEAEKSRLAGALSRALDRGLARAGDIAARYVPELQLPAPELEDYLRQFHYRLGREEARGERLFRRMLDEHDL